MQKILVIGAARSGAAVTELLLAHGYSVVLTDNREEEKIIKEFPMVSAELSDLQKKAGKRLELCFGEQISPDRLSEFSHIVTSPGVPETVPIIQAADRAGVGVLAEPEQAYRLSHTPSVAITGTNGKTTTTTLTGEIFKASGRETYVVGNIGDAVSHYVDQASEDGIFVTEIGSFQLSRCYDYKPVGSLILNITPDHLDRHKTMENYIAAKARVFMNQDANDFVVLNLDDPIVRALATDAPVKKYYISLKQDVENGAEYKDGVLMIKDGGKEIPLLKAEDMGIKGPHNIQNALGAAALSYFCGVAPEVIRDVLRRFKGVEHRQEFVAVKNGVTYINDSKGTNTNASIVAIEAMTTPVVLIAGGYDKKENYDDLAEKVKQKVHTLVLLGATADAIEACMRAHGFENIVRADTFEEAVKQAEQAARPGDTVLLSPACASWGMFDNYEQRGDLFKELVHQIDG